MPNIFDESAAERFEIAIRFCPMHSKRHTLFRSFVESD